VSTAGEQGSTSVGALLLLAVGLLACASSVIFIKASQLEPVLLCALRLWVAVLALLPWYLRDLEREPRRPSHRELLAGAWLPGVVLGAHFIAWVIGARLTPAINASLIVNLVPLVTPVWLFMLLREGISRFEVAGTVVALIGLFLLQAGRFELGADSWVGDGICLIAMVLFALYLVLGRRQRVTSSLWLYVVPLYACAALACSAVSLMLESPARAPWSVREASLALALGVVPTVVGHSILNRSMQHMSAQLVGVANLSQPGFAALLAYLFLNETPPLETYLAGAVVLAGVLLALRGARRALTS